MHHFFLDTNIILDFLADRKPFSKPAVALFNFADEGRIVLYVSAISFNNSYFILRPSNGHHHSINMLEFIESHAEVVELNREILRNAMRSRFSDFEDAIQYYSALTVVPLNAIISRDTNDFKLSRLAVVSPEEAVNLVLNS